MGIRLVVIDDNPHVAWDGRIHPVNATFGQFLPALLEVPGPKATQAIGRIDHCVPVRVAVTAPATLALDPRINVVATAPFDGIGGYLRSAPALMRRNAATLRPVIRAADLVWIKVPASNGPLAAGLARAAGVPRFGYVAGSATAVAGSQDRGVGGGLAARIVGAGYDLAGRLASLGGDRVVVGADLDDGGIVTSLVRPNEIRPAPSLLAASWPKDPGRIGIAWAGRVAPGKGLEALLDAVALLAGAPPDGRRVELAIVGDGPARAELERRAVRLGIADRVNWRGFVADRAAYLDTLADADLFVFPSIAEGFPKVILDAFAVGVPVAAAPSGTLAELGRPGRLAGRGDQRFEPIAANPAGIARSVLLLASDPERARRLRAAGSLFVTAHTRPAEAARLVARWQRRWPDLPWG